MSVRFITFKLIDDQPAANRREPDLDHPNGGEDDGLDVQPADATSARGAAAAGIRWKPLTVSVDTIRNFYPRAGGQEGTRILLKSGTAYAVLNDFADIVTALGGDVADLTR